MVVGCVFIVFWQVPLNGVEAAVGKHIGFVEHDA